MKNSEEALNFAYNNALDLVSNNKLKEGEKLLDRIYNLGYINIDVLNILGIIRYMYCDFYEAKKYWNKSLNLSIENNKASKFIEDIESYDFELISEKYVYSLNLIESKNYLEAIEVLEEINKKRDELVEVKIILSLLYIITGDKSNAFKNIKHAIEQDKSNYKIKEIYYEIKKDLEKDPIEDKYDNTDFYGAISNLVNILNNRISYISFEETKPKT